MNDYTDLGLIHQFLLGDLGICRVCSPSYAGTSRKLDTRSGVTIAVRYCKTMHIINPKSGPLAAKIKLIKQIAKDAGYTVTCVDKIDNWHRI